MKIWLDDERVPPNDTWTWTKSAQDTIVMLQQNDITDISLDHDLGDESIVGNGYHVICWIEERIFIDDFYIPPTITIHTCNSAAALRMKQSLSAITSFLNKRS